MKTVAAALRSRHLVVAGRGRQDHLQPKEVRPQKAGRRMQIQGAQRLQEAVGMQAGCLAVR